MATLKANGILFDMDGVLIDSTPAVERVWSAWAAQRGFDVADTIRRAHGRPSLTTVRELLPHADHQAENRIIEQAEIDDTEGVVPLPGVINLLSALPLDRWAIVTSCTRALAEVRIRAAGLPLPVHFLTSSDITHGKPHPEPYLTGAKLLGFAPSTCIVVEDAPAGVRSGKAAGARVLAVRTTSPDSELIASGADWVRDDCGDIVFSGSDVTGMTLQI
jgi:sugar-phosphatase